MYMYFVEVVYINDLPKYLIPVALFPLYIEHSIYLCFDIKSIPKAA